MTGRAVTVTCPSCDGLTFTVGVCLCVGYGNRMLVTDDQAPREPYQECRVCRGVGQVATACHRCGQRGQRRAQLVLTVANLDTGEVASASVVPGTVPPRPAPDHGWQLPLKPLVDALAEAVGAVTWTDCYGQSDDGSAVGLPREWSPELPDDQRLTLEAQAIAGHPDESWQVFLGRSVAPPSVAPEQRLGQLCALADWLCLDLVLEARRLCQGHDDLLWDVRFDVPGAAVPTARRGTAYSLTEALGTATALSAISGIAARGLAAPARYLVPSVKPADPARPVRDLDQVERRVISGCTDLRTGEPLPGACAIWRDGHWWYTSLRVADRTERLVERDTGQMLRRHTEVLRRGWEPPDPGWLGDAIPHTPCPACDPGSGLRPCFCTVGTATVDPDCDSCLGTGLRAGMLTCHTCLGSHRIFRGLVVTLTDLDHQVVHLNWRAGDAAPAPLVATQPGGKPVVQLPERFRLATHASTFGYARRTSPRPTVVGRSTRTSARGTSRCT
ncbi:hypothetical protein ABNF97_01750 [Plantactinospora sp. B6F1]|uniref:hypothetical protein n=1 Tax=Plantactinospora sp. B6F1 TaxID=3158971 RepID=UPI0032D9A1A9